MRFPCLPPLRHTLIEMPPKETTSAPAPSSLRVLVIDDDEVDRLRVLRMLRLVPEWEAKVEVAVDLASGLTAIRAQSFDCVLLDYRLPDGEGPDLLKALRATEGQGPPIIMQTVLDHEATAVAALAQGAQDYLVKGRFDGAALRRAIRYAIQRDQLVKERLRLLRELHEAQAKVKTLEGLLPTCAWCNRIKDEHDRWLPFESYIAAHSEAQFTHGICPECLHKQTQDLGPAH